MKKYRVSETFYVNFSVEIKANNKEDAIRLSYQHHPKLCRNCDEQLEIFEVTKSNLKVEEIE